MSPEVTPMFENVPDKYLATVLSEPIVRPLDFKVRVTGDPEEENFPPEPSYPRAILSAYITEEGGVHRQFMAVPVQNGSPSELAEGFVNEYSELIPHLHELSEFMYETGPDLTSGLVEYALKKTQEARLKTVGAFIVYSAASDPHKFYSGLMIPKPVYNDIPLKIRDMVFEAISGLSKGRKDIMSQAEELQAGASDWLKVILRNDPNNAVVAFSIAASLLPKSEMVRQLVGRNPNFNGRGNTQKIDRKTRREQERQQRRADRKKRT